MFVAIAESMSNDPDLAPVGVHPGGKASHPYIAVRTLSPSDGLGVGYRILPSLVRPTDEVFITIPGLQMSTAVSLVEIPLAVRSSHHGVETVIMIPTIESAENVLPPIYLRIEPQVTINIGIDNQVRRLCHHHLVAEHADPKRSNKLGILHEDV